MKNPPIIKIVKDDGEVQYHIEVEPGWDGFDSFVNYLKRYWHAEVSESNDLVYSRRWVLRSGEVPISIYHDSQLGNYFLREDGVKDQLLLDNIALDVAERLSSSS